MKLTSRALRRASAVAVAAVVAVAMSGCAPSSGSTTTTTAAVTQAEIDKAMKTPTTLNYWTWLPDASREVALFEKKYPAIKVKISNVGTGLPFYTKVRTAIRAGNAPDLAQFEFASMPSFAGDFLDLAPYGGSTLKNDFSPAIWSQVADGKAVYGVPQDFGPMGAVWRKDIFAKAGVPIPKTWDEFATAAKTIHEKTGGYITDVSSSTATWMLALMSQAGLRPFSYDGKKTVNVNLTSPEAKKFISYWNDLVKQDLVGVGPDFVTDWYQNVNSGNYASWMVAAWGPVFMTGPLKSTSGKWTATALPQYDAANPVSAYWGGAAGVGFKGTKNPIQTYELLKFLNASPESTTLLATTQSLYVAYLPTLNSAAVNDQKSAFFGGQQVNQTYNAIAKTVKPGFEFLPFQDYVATTYNTTLGKSIANRTDLTAGLEAWQAAIVSYAKQQGFTVTTK